MRSGGLQFDTEFPSPQLRHNSQQHTAEYSVDDLHHPPPLQQQQQAVHKSRDLIVSDWELVEDHVPLDHDIPLREALFAIGNGYIGIRGFHEHPATHPSSPAGGAPPPPPPVSADTIANHLLRGSNAPQHHQTLRTSVFESTLSHNPVAGPTQSHCATYVNGVYDEHSTSKASSAFSSGCCKRECFLVAVPDAADISLLVDDELVAPFAHPSRVSQYRRTLDLKTGELKRKYVWTTRSNVELQIVESRIVCAARKHIAAFHYSVTSLAQPGNPTAVEVKVVSSTTLPSTAATSWEMDVAPSGSRRQEDSSSVFSARTRGSRKHITLAVNDRCFVTTHNSSSMDNLLGEGSQQLGGSVIGGTSGSAAPLPAILSSPMAQAMFGSPPPIDVTAQFSRSATNNVGGQHLLNAATFLTPICTTPMRPATEGSNLGNTPPQLDHATESVPHSIEMIFRASMLCSEVCSTLTFSKTVAYVTDADCEVEDMEGYSGEVVEDAVDHRYEGLLAEQQEFMENFWTRSDVTVSCTKSKRLQGTLRFNILQLFMSTGRWKGTGVGPRGLTGEVFNGLQTWDAEIFVFPFFLHSHPQIARSLLQFRVDTLPEAQRRAFDFELPRGAIYPSRTINGAENALSLPCSLHLHVNADIAYAIQRYYEATHDLEFLTNGGAVVVWSTAVIWLLWGAWEYGSFHIRSVTGPDEYNVLVHDNFFTNIMARNHMRFAVELFDMLSTKHRGNLCDVEYLMASACVTPEDFVAMKRAADKIALPYDPHHRIHLQDAGFLRKRAWHKVPQKEHVSHASPLRSHLSPNGSDVNLESLNSSAKFLPPRSSATNGPPSNSSHYADPTSDQYSTAPLSSRSGAAGHHHHHHVKSNSSLSNASNITPQPTSPQPYMLGEEGTPVVMIQEYHPVVVFRHRICKNADVVLAAVLLRDKFTHDEKEANFRFYERLTAHDSSLIAPMFCIAASDVQLREEAVEYFKYALYIDMNNVLKNTSGGLHLSCLGGSWWCIVAGFGGFCVLDGVAHFNPWVPDGWSDYKFHVRHHGAVVHVSVSRRSVSYLLVEGTKLLIVHAQTARVHLAKGRPVSIKLVRDVRSIDFDAVVFDLDSIIDSVEEDQFHAWQKTLDPLFVAKDGAEHFKPFNSEMYLAYLRHHPISQNKRHQGLQRLLQKRGIDLPVGDPSDPASDASLYGLTNRKLHNFRSIVKARGVHLRSNVMALISDLKENGVLIGVVSASKNGSWMMQQASGIHDIIDYFIDANVGEAEKLKWRPELDFFDCCTKRLDVPLDRTVIFVDGIDGFSKKSLLQYWLVVNTSLDEDEDSGRGISDDAEGIPQLNLHHFEGLSTDTLHERGTFVPYRTGNAPTASVAMGGTSQPTFPATTTPHATLKGNSSFAAMPSNMQSVYV
jgi:trehalose/maltose hydrolase-like predicted phosphorylase/beta-phosphoglucomutase-like phosphatase (HAD superfamily)